MKRDRRRHSWSSWNALTCSSVSRSIRSPTNGCDLGKVLLDVGDQGAAQPEVGRRARGPEEFGQPTGDLLERARIERLARQQRLRARLVGESPHVDGPVGDRPFAADGVSGGGLANRLDPQVHLRRQTLVQPHLLLAGALARLDAAKVEEAEVNRPLHLPDVVADQEYPGGVGREQLDDRGRVPAIRLGPQQIVDQLAGIAAHLGGDQAASRTWWSWADSGRGFCGAAATKIERGRALNGPIMSANVLTPQHTAITSSVSVDRKMKGDSATHPPTTDTADARAIVDERERRQHGRHDAGDNGAGRVRRPQRSHQGYERQDRNEQQSQAAHEHREPPCRGRVTARPLPT